MRLGLLARAENRGLGIQTADFFRHLHPTKTLVVDTSAHARPQDIYPLHVERFPGSRLAVLEGGSLHPTEAVGWLLDDIDLLFAAETFYDPDLLDRARSRGVRTVCQANREFWNPAHPQPDQIVVPTDWRIDEMPGARLLPHGVDRSRFAYEHRTHCRAFVHVAGHPAMGDRAGTRLVLRALPHLPAGMRVILRSQQALPTPPSTSATVEVHAGTLADSLDLYAGADVLVAPRRFGGQSLPVNEALSLGMPVIALDRDPERSWPGVHTIPARSGQRLHSHSAPLDAMNADPSALAQAMVRLATDDRLMSELSEAADQRAAAISWEVMVPRYLRLFAEVLA